MGEKVEELSRGLFTSIGFHQLIPFSLLLCWAGVTLWQLQKFLQDLKYTLLAFTPSTNQLISLPLFFQLVQPHFKNKIEYQHRIFTHSLCDFIPHVKNTFKGKSSFVASQLILSTDWTNFSWNTAQWQEFRRKNQQP
jgi:hypothetical protein